MAYDPEVARLRSRVKCKKFTNSSGETKIIHYADGRWKSCQCGEDTNVPVSPNQLKG